MDDLLDKYSVEYYVTLSTQAQAAATPAILSDKLLDNIVLEMERAAKNGKFGTMFDVAMPYTVTAAQLVKALHEHFRGFHKSHEGKEEHGFAQFFLARFQVRWQGNTGKKL